MQSIITHLSCTHPCNCKPCVSLDGKKIANSYGWRLHDPIYAERSEMEIRNEIIQCMNEKPADRPDLISLLMAIARRKKKGFDETDEEIRDFWEGFWGPSEQQQKQQQQQHQFGSQINGIASGRKPPDRACKRQRAVQGVTVEEETPRSREAVAPPRKKIKISPPESPQRLAAGDPVALRLEALKRKRMGDKEQYPTNDTSPLQCHAANSPSFVHTRQNGSHGPKAYSMDINGDGKDKSGGESSGLPKEPPEPVILRFPVVYDSTSSIVDESMHEAPPPSPPNLFNSQTVRRDFNASASCFEPILSMFWRRQHPPPQPQPQPPVEPPHWRVPGFGNVTSFFNNFLDGRTPAEPYPKTASMMSGIIMTDHEQQRAQQETQSSEFFRILNSNLPWPSLRLKRKMSGVVRTGDMQNHQAIENLILRNTRLESTVLQDSTLMSWKSPWHGGGGGKDTMARPCISTWANSGPGLFNKTCYRTLMSQDDASDPRSRWLGRDNSFLAPGPMDLD